MDNPEQFLIDHKVHTEVIASFRRRAARLSRYSVVIIALIILVLAAGIGIFIYAGKIANKESNEALLTEKRNNLTALENEVNVEKGELDKRHMEVSLWRDKYEQEIRGKGVTGAQGEGRMAEYYLRNVKAADDNVRWHESRLQALLERLDLMRAELSKAEEASNESIGISQNQIPVLVSAFATRVGAVVLLLFLVQILVPLYRYNMKLSSYYDARADALMLISTAQPEGTAGSNGTDGTNILASARTSVDALERLVAALSPDYIDFGKAPATPAEHALRFAKDVITSQRK